MTKEIVIFFTLLLVAVTQVSGSLEFTDVTTTSVSVQWQPGENLTAENYTVEYSLNDNVPEVPDISYCKSDKLCAELTGLAPGTTYTVEVLADDDTEHISNVTTKPSPVTNIVFNTTNQDSITVTWDEPTSGLVDDYTVALLAPASATISNSTVPFGGHGTGVVVSGVLAGDMVNVSVIVNSQGEESVAESATIRTKPTAVDPSSIHVTIDEETSKAVCTWTKPALTVADTYTVSVAPAPPLSGVQVTPSSNVDFDVTDPSVTLTGVTPGLSVTLRIRVLSDSESSEVAETTFVRKPLAVDNGTIEFLESGDAGDYSVKWTVPDSKVDNYIVWLAEPNKNAALTESSVTEAEVSLENVSPGQRLVFYVVVTSHQTNSSTSEATLVRQPSSVDVSSIEFDTSDPEQIQVSWAAAAGFGDKYLLSVSPSTAVVPSDVAFTSVDLKAVITGLQPGQQATVTIKVDSHGNIGLPAEASIRRNPAPVVDLTIVEITNTSASVRWTKPDGVVSGYSLTLTPSEGVTFVPDAPLYGIDVTEVELSGLTAGKKYNVSVVVHSGEKNSSIQTKEFTSKPNGVDLTVKQISANQVNLTWTATGSSEEVVYELFYKAVLRDLSSPDQQENTSETSLLLVVVPGERYEFVIRPRLSGEHYGENTTAQITIRPLAPGDLSVVTDAIMTTSVDVKWGTVDLTTSFAEGYYLTYKPTDDKQPSETKTVGVEGAEVDNVTLPDLIPGRQYQVNLWTITGHDIKSGINRTVNVTARPVLNTILTDVTPRGKYRQLQVLYTVNDDEYWDDIRMEKVIAEGVATKARGLTDTTMVFAGLTSGTPYDIKVWVTSNGISSEVTIETFYTAPKPLESVDSSTPGQNRIDLVWLKVDNESVVNIFCVTNETLNRTVGPTTSRISYEGLQPYTQYEFKITVVKYNKSSTEKEVTITTIESPPSAVSEFTVAADQNDPYTSARLDWKKPAHPRGNIYRYVVRYNGTSTNQPDIHLGEEFYESNNQDTHSELLTVLKGGRRYNLTISAENNAGRGEGRSEYHDTQIGVPYLVEPQYKPTAPTPPEVTQTSFKIRFKRVFDDKNGYIRGYSVIVYEDVNKGVPLLDNILTWKKVSASEAPWAPYYATRECQIFSSSSACEKPNAVVNGGRKKRAVVEEITFQIGVQDCRNAGEDAPCNGALSPGKKYRVLLRAHSADKTSDTQFSEPFETVSSNTPLPIIIGVVIALIFMFVALLVVAGWIYYKYKPCGQAEKGPVGRPPARPVRIQQFPNHYRFMSADADFRFCEEYECLRLVGVEQSIDEARKDYNCGKNRFANISPYDWSRIKLSMMDDVPGSDYINANYMPGHNSPREFLVCQGPLVATVDDFWRMIWEQNCTAIVMLTKLIDNGREKCVQYWPSDTNPIRYGDILVAVANETCYENFNVMELRLQKDGRTRAVRHFFYKAWPDFGVPVDTESLLKFIVFIRKRILKAQPICVHCSAGVGRSGTYIALDRLILDMETGKEFVDIYGTVHEMRRHRCLMVQTEQQYIFIHRAIRDIIEGVVCIESLQPICNTNLAYNEDEGVQLEMMA